MSKVKGQKKLEEETVYRFCGNGLGIGGLPHEVTRKQAEALGLLEQFEAALENGNYKPVNQAKEA